MQIKHLISIKHLSSNFVEKLLQSARKMEANPEAFSSRAKGKILADLFFEPSTRTRLSFESAMLRLGGNMLGFSSPKGTSVEKGESLADTIRMAHSYADIIVLRHYIEGAGRVAAEISDVPVISGGTGSQEHPTQALLDLYTIWKHHERFSNLKVAIVGDLRYGRTVPSLSYILSLFPNNKVFYCSPRQLRVRREVLNEIEGKLEYEELEDLEDILPEVDVAYITRVQKERFPDPQDYLKVRDSYVITPKILKDVKESFILLHPLPRVGEISYEVDSLPLAKYFEQAKNGVYVRMAILDYFLNYPWEA